ncbi:hypothetical protein UlMin_010474 [Ulmus minor]
MAKSRVLLISFATQGHINPALQFAKQLIRTGVDVTFVTTIYAHRRMSEGFTPNGLSFAPFSDGNDDGDKPSNSFNHLMTELKCRGSQAVYELLVSGINDGRPFTCLVYTLLLPWAAEVARQFSLPSVLLWVQSASVFDIFYSYFHGYGDDIVRNCSTKDPSVSMILPGLPLLTSSDLPSFMDASNANSYMMSFFREQFETLDRESNPRVLVNTFEVLEPEALRAISEMNLIGIGPLLPSAFLDENDASDTSFGGDLYHCSQDCVKWLNSKPKASVVYVSFGSTVHLSKLEMEEIARCLVACGLPFLWVIRDKGNGQEGKEEYELSCREELEKLGMMVRWCSQVKVLSSPSLGCFVTHCGWNSSLESLAFGVPMVALPRMADQITNAKLIEDLWKTGVRVKPNKDGVVEGDEIKRCLDLVMGEEERGKEIRRNANKLKELAREAAKEGGSSNANFRAFLNEVIGEGFSMLE